VLAVADRNIPQVTEALAGVAEVRTFPSSELTRENLRDAELLFTRSTVKVGPALLDGTRVRFVATATIGIDHLDVPWLESRGISWASAPGSNADSVLQWWAAALLTLHERRQLDLRALTVGIVGVGNVGSRVERFCRALELPLLLNDPPRQAREGGELVPLDRIFGDCDLITAHVPLDDSTRHMIDPARLQEGAWLVNASRGEVVVAPAANTVLDVFPGEPSVPRDWVERCALATPHIAGHSVEGKLNGTRMVVEAACRFLGVTPAWRPTLPPRAPLDLLDDADDETLLLRAIRSTYRIEDDDAALRQIVAGPHAAGDPAGAFRRYREQYPERRELSGVEVRVPTGRARLAAALQALGARVR
jgi:erythronate-4-phosphate dehydrogenase